MPLLLAGEGQRPARAHEVRAQHVRHPRVVVAGAHKAHVRNNHEHLLRGVGGDHLGVPEVHLLPVGGGRVGAPAVGEAARHQLDLLLGRGALGHVAPLVEREHALGHAQVGQGLEQQGRRHGELALGRLDALVQHQAVAARDEGAELPPLPLGIRVDALEEDDRLLPRRARTDSPESAGPEGRRGQVFTISYFANPTSASVSRGVRQPWCHVTPTPTAAATSRQTPIAPFRPMRRTAIFHLTQIVGGASPRTTAPSALA